MSKVTTLKGDYEGTMLACLEWQAEMQGGMAEIDGIDIADLALSLPGDPHRKAGDLTPEQALAVVQRRIQD